MDDFLGVTQKKFLEEDMKVAKEVAERLLGKFAISEKKTYHGPILDWIGWEVNLLTKTVTIANIIYTRPYMVSLNWNAGRELRLEKFND